MNYCSFSEVGGCVCLPDSPLGSVVAVVLGPGSMSPRNFVQGLPAAGSAKENHCHIVCSVIFRDSFTTLCVCECECV